MNVFVQGEENAREDRSIRRPRAGDERELYREHHGRLGPEGSRDTGPDHQRLLQP